MASGRQQYTDREDKHLVEFLATYNPTGTDRRGNKLWKDTLCGNLDKFPWAKTHPWQSWRDHYKKSDVWFDRKIKKIVKQKRRKEAELPPDDDTEADAEPRAASPKKRRRKSGRDSDDDEVEDAQKTPTKQPQKKRKVDESSLAVTATRDSAAEVARAPSNDGNGASSAQESPRPRPVTPPRQPVTPQRQPVTPPRQLRTPRPQAATPPPEPVTPRPRTTTSRPKPATPSPHQQPAALPPRQLPRRAVRDKQPRASSSKVLVEDMYSESEVDEGSVYEPQEWVEDDENGHDADIYGEDVGPEEQDAQRADEYEEEDAREDDYAAEDEEEYAEEDEAALLLATEDLMEAHEARDMPASDDYGMVSEYIAMEVPPIDEDAIDEEAQEYDDGGGHQYEIGGALEREDEDAQAYEQDAQVYGYHNAHAYEEAAPAYEPQTPDQIDEDQENRIPEPEPSSIPHGVPGYSPVTSSTPSSPSPPERIYPDLRQLPSPNLQRQITAALRKHASVPTLRSTPLRAMASLPAPRRKPSPPRTPSPPCTPPRRKLPPLPPLPTLNSAPLNSRRLTPTESSPQSAVPIPEIRRTSPPTERPTPLTERRAPLAQRPRPATERQAARVRPSAAPTPMPDPPSEPPADTEWPAPETELLAPEIEQPALEFESPERATPRPSVPARTLALRKKLKKDIFDDTSSASGTPAPRGGTPKLQQVARTAPQARGRPAQSAMRGARTGIQAPQAGPQVPQPAVGLIDPLPPYTPPAQRSKYVSPVRAPPVPQAIARPLSPHTPPAQRSKYVSPQRAAAAPPKPVAQAPAPPTARIAESDSPPPRQPRKLQEGAFGGPRFVQPGNRGEDSREGGEAKRWPPIRRKRRRSETEEEEGQMQTQPAKSANVEVGDPQVPSMSRRDVGAERGGKRPRRTFIAPRNVSTEEASAPAVIQRTPLPAKEVAALDQAQTRAKQSVGSPVEDVFTEPSASRRASDATAPKAPAQESTSALNRPLSRVPSIARTASFHSPTAPARQSVGTTMPGVPTSSLAGSSRRHTIAAGTPSGLLDLRRFAVTRKGSNTSLRHSRASSIATRTSIAPSEATFARALSEVSSVRAPSIPASFLTDIDTSQDRKMLEDLGAEVAVKRLSNTWGFAEPEVRNIFEQYDRSLSRTERCLSVMREGARRAAEEWQEALERSTNASDAGSSASGRADSAVQAGEPSVIELSQSFAPQDASTPQGQQARPAGQLQISPPSAPRQVEERAYSPPAHTRSAKYARLQREGRTEEARAREARRASGGHSRPSFLPQVESVQVKEEPKTVWTDADERLLRSGNEENLEEVRALTARTDMGFLLGKVQAFAGEICDAARQRHAKDKGKGKVM
ncbi:hypothetical protein GGF50DRAFT_113369 [Schizophyllum commune]